MTTEKISVVHELMNLIGMDATVRLCIVFGGTKLYIGNSERARQRLSVVVGDEMVGKLMSFYQGMELDIPKMENLKKVRRDTEIIADAANGMSQRELSLKYELTERQIRNILPSALSENDSRNETD